MHDAQLRVGLIGFGLAGAYFHAPLIATTPGLSLSAVVTGNRERAAQAVASYPGVQVVAAVEQLWDLGLDLVVVATPNRTHIPLAGRALEAGIAVVVDKPFAPTAAEARELVEEARPLNLLLTVFQNRRWDGDFLTVKGLIERGVLGDVHRFESRFERWRPVPKPGWRESGAGGDAGGTLFDLGSHLIDQAIQLFGPVDDVYAELDRRRPGVEVEDDAFVALSHTSGTRSHLRMSATSGLQGPRFQVFGSQAAFVKHGMDIQEEALRNGERPDRHGWGEEPAKS